MLASLSLSLGDECQMWNPPNWRKYKCQHNVIIKQYNIQYRTNNIGKHENNKQINLQYKLLYTTPRATKIHFNCILDVRDNTNINVYYFLLIV